MRTTPGDDTALSCARPGCLNTISPAATGRPRIFCSTKCKAAVHSGRLSVEVDHEPVPDGERPTGRVFLVRLCRGNRSVIIATELGRPSADHLARQIDDLIGSRRRAKGGAVE
jgi:hypothetical protein